MTTSTSIKLPGFVSTFYLNQPIISGGNFTWGEATKNGTRIPTSKDIVENILAMANHMQAVRQRLGDRPIIVTSWYRDPASNRAAGGASNSYHLTGKAVDFQVPGMANPEVQRRLDAWWGDRGGMGSYPGFTHLDCRGYRSRWC